MLYEVCVYIYTLKMLKSDWDQYFRLSHKLSVKVKTAETIDRIPVFKVVFFKKQAENTIFIMEMHTDFNTTTGFNFSDATVFKYYGSTTSTLERNSKNVESCDSYYNKTRMYTSKCFKKKKCP